tara:strand:+ start:116 stop:415 length:300 start_codon:yes stop_codon:yes gene_type:complete
MKFGLVFRIFYYQNQNENQNENQIQNENQNKIINQNENQNKIINQNENHIQNPNDLYYKLIQNDVTYDKRINTNTHKINYNRDASNITEIDESNNIYEE